MKDCPSGERKKSPKETIKFPMCYYQVKEKKNPEMGESYMQKAQLKENEIVITHSSNQ